MSAANDGSDRNIDGDCKLLFWVYFWLADDVLLLCPHFVDLIFLFINESLLVIHTT